MAKREVTDSLVGVLCAILRDCEQNYPRDRLEWKRDNKRIHQGAVSRGMPFFLMDMPQLGDWLYASLSAGRLSRDQPVALSRRKSATDLRPRFLWALWSRLFDSDGLLLVDADPTALFLLNTLCLVWKKAEVACPPKNIREAYNDYFRIETQLPPSSPIWDEVSEEVPDLGSLGDLGKVDLGGDFPVQLKGLLEDCQRVSDILVSELGFFSTEEVVGKHGPGAVADLKRKENKNLFPSWSAKLESVFPMDIFGVVNHSSDFLQGTDTTSFGLFEEASYLTDVPKTRKAPRLIAEEPTSHQWIQQGCALILCRRVSGTQLGLMLDFHSQHPSQEACREASLFGTRATIDLSSASDRVSTWLVQRIFRRNWSLLKWLIATRTRFLKQDKYADLPTISRLRKFASMGSALTFPVESIVFASLALGVGKSLHPAAPLRTLARQVRVFGDDIIVPVDWVVPLVSVLEAVGLKVNREKSFSTGFIRESCGLHAWRGHDITPFRLRYPFRDAVGAIAVSMVQSASNAHRKGLWHTSAYIEKAVSRGKRFLRVGPFAPQVGLLTFCNGVDPDARIAYDRHTQQETVLGFSFKVRTNREEIHDGINDLAELGSAVYKDRSRWVNLMAAPKVGSLNHEIVTVVEGPAILRRTRVPLYLLKRGGTH